MKNIKYINLLIPILIGISCNQTKKINNVLTCYRLRFNMPFVRDSGILMNVTDSADILYYNEFRIARIYIKSILQNNKGLVYDTTKYSYFISKKAQSNGYYYNSLFTDESKIINVDSLFKKKYLMGFVIKPSDNDSLIEKKEKSDVLLMKFLSKKHFDESYPDTTIYQFNKDKNNIDYSISKTIDTLKNMKLSKIRCIYDNEKSNNYSFILPARELYLELFEFKLPNEKEIIDFVNRFAKAHP